MHQSKGLDGWVVHNMSIFRTFHNQILIDFARHNKTGGPKIKNLYYRPCTPESSHTRNSPIKSVKTKATFALLVSASIGHQWPHRHRHPMQREIYIHANVLFGILILCYLIWRMCPRFLDYCRSCRWWGINFRGRPWSRRYSMDYVITVTDTCDGYMYRGMWR